jgi:hypothetical protein
MPEDEGASKLEAITVWGRARSILMGKSRGRNLIVLGVFLIFVGAIDDAIVRYVLHGSESYAMIFVVMGALAFGVGLGTYVGGD